MRILKRNLAFVLAMVMALSLTVSAANVTDYTDADDITFVEAVDVMTAIGVLEGTDGAFNPTKTLTREEGAKIIAYLMLGKTAADNLNVAEAPFTDVPANRWSAGYVAYCASQGIVKGVSATEFNPKGELTGTAFATMLLRAVGYGVNGEFEGARWESEANAMALKLNIFKGNLGVNFSAACKREEAALYAFNTLTKVNTVNYSELFGTYYAGSTVLDVEEENFKTLNEECGYFVYDKSDVKDATDAFGRHGHVWVDTQGDENAKNDVVLTGIYGSTADKVYTTAVTLDDIKEDLDNEDLTIDVVKFNGKNVEKDLTKTGKGILTEVYELEDDKLEVIIIATYAAKVTNVDKKNEVTTISYQNVAGTANCQTELETVEFAKGDIVLVTVASVANEDYKYGVQTIELAETFEGTVTAKGASYVKIDGEKYEYAAKYVGTNDVVYDEAYTVVMDEYGYIIDMIADDNIDEAADIEGYVYLVQAQGQIGESDMLSSSDDMAKVKVNFLNGEKAVVMDLATEYDGEDEDIFSYVTVEKQGDDLVEVLVPVAPVETVLEELTEGFYGYYMIDDAIVLVPLNLTEGTQYLNKTYTFDETRKLGKHTMNTKTELVVIDGTDVTTTVGYKNMDTTVEGDFLVVEAKGVVETVYVLGKTEAAVEDETIIAYYTGEWTETDEFAVELIIDGVADMYVYDKATQATINGLVKGNLYVVTMNTSDEVTNLTTEGANNTEYTVTKVEAGNYINVEGSEKNYYFADEYVVYDVELGETVEEVAEDDVIKAVVEDGFITVLYIVK